MEGEALNVTWVMDETVGHKKTWQSRAGSPLRQASPGGVQDVGHVQAQQGH